ncbi:MAG: hypothetical protein IT320_14180 [Anaerolineae bacterium]|nr:hypothetical protein [Anaerolineae bacterium]
MAENGHKNVDELREEANRELREFGREVRSKADEAKKEVVARLFDAADTIRREAREANASKDAEQAADNVAKGLEKAAHYLKRRSYEDMGDDVERVVKRRPMRALGIALVTGIVIGMILRGGSRD